jgi:hypothetical protein
MEILPDSLLQLLPRADIFLTCRTHFADDDSFREFVMRTLAVQDVAIAVALRNGDLSVKSFVNRFGDTMWSISDKHGPIEICGSQSEADDKVATVAEAMLA